MVSFLTKKFHLGRCSITPACEEAITDDQVQDILRRHQGGDWGDIGSGDRSRNERTLRQGEGPLRSVYEVAGRDGLRITVWIVTDGIHQTQPDERCTTVLLPDDH